MGGTTLVGFYLRGVNGTDRHDGPRAEESRAVLWLDLVNVITLMPPSVCKTRIVSYCSPQNP